MVIGLLLPDRAPTPCDGRAQHYKRHGISDQQKTRRFENGTTLTFGPNDPVDKFEPGDPFYEQTLIIVVATDDINAEIDKYRKVEAASLGIDKEELSLLNASFTERFPGHFRGGSNESIAATQIGLEDAGLNSFGEGDGTELQRNKKRSTPSVYQSMNHSNTPGLAHPGFSRDTRGGGVGYPGGPTGLRTTNSPAQTRGSSKKYSGIKPDKYRTKNSVNGMNGGSAFDFPQSETRFEDKHVYGISGGPSEFVAHQGQKATAGEYELQKQSQFVAGQGDEFQHLQVKKNRGRSRIRQPHSEKARSMRGSRNGGSMKGLERGLSLGSGTTQILEQPPFLRRQRNLTSSKFLKLMMIKDEILLIPRGRPGLPLAYLINPIESLNHPKIQELYGPREKWVWMFEANLNKVVNGQRTPELEAILNAIIFGDNNASVSSVVPSNNNDGFRHAMGNFDSGMKYGPRMGHIREASDTSSVWHKEPLEANPEQAFLHAGSSIMGAGTRTVSVGTEKQHLSPFSSSAHAEVPVNALRQVSSLQTLQGSQYLGYCIPGEQQRAMTPSPDPSPNRGWRGSSVAIQRRESRLSSPGGYVSQQNRQESEEKDSIVRSRSQIFPPTAYRHGWA